MSTKSVGDQYAAVSFKFKWNLHDVSSINYKNTQKNPAIP